MKKMSTVDWVAWVLVVLGAVNWGLLGVARLNLAESVLGATSLVQLFYVLVGLAGLYFIWMTFGKK